MSFGSMPNRRVMAYFGKNIVIEFEFDRAGWRKIAVGEDLRAATTSIVRDRALPYAKQISPYDPKNRSTTHYRDSFVITQGFEIINDLRRVATRLFNVSGHSTEVEFLNSGKTGGPLRRTVSYLVHESIVEELLKNHEREFKRKQRSKQASNQPRGARGRFIPKRR